MGRESYLRVPITMPEEMFAYLEASSLKSKITGGRKGKLVGRLSGKPDILLSTILIGNNLVNIGASALATKLTIELFGSSAIGIMTGVMTFVILVFGEVTPKHVAIQNNTFVCLHTARLVWLLSFLFRPAIWAITGISRFITRLVGTRRRAVVSIQEILRAVHLAETAGVLKPHEKQMVKNVFRLGALVHGPYRIALAVLSLVPLVNPSRARDVCPP